MTQPEAIRLTGGNLSGTSELSRYGYGDGDKNVTSNDTFELS